MSTISTHVLNTATGRPGAGMVVVFDSVNPDGNLEEISRAPANADGRVVSLLPAGKSLDKGNYRLTFDTSGYFSALGLRCFYPKVEIFFEITDSTEHYHIPLLVSPYSYSTYRGS